MLSLGRYPGQGIAIGDDLMLRYLALVPAYTTDPLTDAVVLGVETDAGTKIHTLGVDETLVLSEPITVTTLGIGNTYSERTNPPPHKPKDYLRLGIEAPREIHILREELLQRREEDEVRQAAEAVVATAFGGDGGPGYDHSYGLTEAQQLEALRGACQALADVLNPPPHIEMACGAYVEDEREAKLHSRDCRNCKEVVAEDKADMAHSDGEPN